MNFLVVGLILAMLTEWVISYATIRYLIRQLRQCELKCERLRDGGSQ